MLRLVLASNNARKLSELRTLLGGLAVELVAPHMVAVVAVPQLQLVQVHRRSCKPG